MQKDNLFFRNGTVCPVFYHDNTDGHTNACCSIDDPVVLLGVQNLPHQHHGLPSAERERQGNRRSKTTQDSWCLQGSPLQSPSKNNSSDHSNNTYIHSKNGVTRQDEAQVEINGLQGFIDGGERPISFHQEKHPVPLWGEKKGQIVWVCSSVIYAEVIKQCCGWSQVRSAMNQTWRQTSAFKKEEKGFVLLPQSLSWWVRLSSGVKWGLWW